MWVVLLLVLSIAFIVLATARLHLHPFLALLITAFGFGILAGMPLNQIVESVNAGFGGTIGHIGIVILAGSIIGKFLEKSGGAYRLAKRTLQMVGERNVPAAMGIVGYIVSMPVFADSAFVLLSPLNKALVRGAGITLAGSAIALSLGLAASHTMVPPTPGPVAAAGVIGADLGLVIVWGLIVSSAALVAGWLFAVLYASRTWISPHGEAEQEVEPVSPDSAPSVGMSLLPILVPIILIVLGTLVRSPADPDGPAGFAAMLSFVGQPVVALLVGVALAAMLPRDRDRRMFSDSGWVGEAIIAAAGIIIITGAGGAFGRVLQDSGIVGVIGESLADAPLGIWLPFMIAAGIKTAQGSSTVAIITTAGLMAPLLGPLGLDSETAKALVVVAIGAGSLVVSHANDSFFWVVTRFCGMSVPTGYRLLSLGTLVIGAAAGLVLWLLSLILL
ncbi:MAG: GntP family permease [Pseudomonadota bacterium]